MNEQSEKVSTSSNDDYDSPWKEAIEHYFPEFMEFYFPDAYVQIDWSKEYVFLDQELRSVVKDAELGKRFVDKLIRVSLLNGEGSWIYIHVEVQGTKQEEFTERIFVYNYRLYDRYHCPIASMAVLADDNAQWKPTSFRIQVLGCTLGIEFPVAKLSDYRDKVGIDGLLTSENVFALITAAHILTQQTSKKEQERFQAKLTLIRILYQRQWDKQRIIKLFSVIDWMMSLPEWLEQQLMREIEIIEETGKMQYITSIERIGIAKGRLEGISEGFSEGIEKGIEKGIVKGIVKGASKLLGKQMERRFGTLPEWVRGKLNNASEQELEFWGEAVLEAASLEAIFENDTTH